MHVRSVLRCWPGEEGRAAGGERLGSRRSDKRGMGTKVWAGKEVVREKPRWGRSRLTFLSTFEEVVEEGIGEVGMVRWEREEQEEDGWIGPGKVLLLCGGVRERGDGPGGEYLYGVPPT